jgi:hypothetical protein
VIGRTQSTPIGKTPVIAAIVAFAVAACGSPLPPASPTTAFRPEIVGVATNVKPLDCGLSRVTLAGGEEVNLAMAGSALNYDTPCPATTTQAAWRAFGDNKSEKVEDHVFFFGHDVSGKPWYGWARPVDECPEGTYSVLGGAYEEVGAFHLSNGVVLGKSPDFDSAQMKSSSVVPNGGGLCVDARGGVLKTWEPMGPA